MPEPAGAFEVVREAKERYRVFAYWQRGVPTTWDAFLAGFKAGSVFATHQSGVLLDEEFVLAIRAISVVMGVAQEPAIEGTEDPVFKRGAAWMLTTSGQLSGPVFRRAIQVLAEALSIERGPVRQTCTSCGEVTVMAV